MHLQIGHKLEKWQWPHSLQTGHHLFFFFFFGVAVFLLPSLVIRPSLMSISSQVLEFFTIFFYKRLTRNPKIGNTHVWVLPNIWRLGQVRDTEFGTDVSNEMLLNAAKYQGYIFYSFWVIKGKPTGGKPPLPD